MTDIFISYAKADRPLALKLAAMLEAEGWTTWWDTSLTIGDDFRNEIMTELGRARAVIVIWTDASIKSDWVRSEAGRAQADRKLIPVKLPHLVYEDLPPPFDVLHTENIGEEDKIKAAVIAQLAKPAVEPSSWALLTKGFRYELLTWVGIVGGAVTLFGNLDSVLKLADWARVLVKHWKEWTHAFWGWVFGWLGIYLQPFWTPMLSFLLFGSFLIISQAYKSRKTLGTDLRTYISLNATMNATNRLDVLLSVGLFYLFYSVIVLDQFETLGVDKITFYSASVIPGVLQLILLRVAPAKAVARRLIFLALCLLLLIGLNELSKLGIDLAAPKLQG